jgi:hypothetical protein
MANSLLIIVLINTKIQYSNIAICTVKIYSNFLLIIFKYNNNKKKKKVSKNTGCFKSLHQSQHHSLVADKNRANLHQWTHVHFFARLAHLACLARLVRLAPHPPN